MTEYSVKIGKTLLEYTVEGSELRCRVRSQSALTLQVNLADPNMRLKPERMFRMQFKLGLIGIVLPLWTFGVIYWKEGDLDIFPPQFSTYLHGTYFIAGIILVLMYRKPLRGFFATADGKAGILLWRDRKKADDFDRFIASVRAGMALQTPAPATIPGPGS